MTPGIGRSADAPVRPLSLFSWPNLPRLDAAARAGQGPSARCTTRPVPTIQSRPPRRPHITVVVTVQYNRRRAVGGSRSAETRVAPTTRCASLPLPSRTSLCARGHSPRHDRVSLFLRGEEFCSCQARVVCVVSLCMFWGALTTRPPNPSHGRPEDGQFGPQQSRVVTGGTAARGEESASPLRKRAASRIRGPSHGTRQTPAQMSVRRKQGNTKSTTVVQASACSSATCPSQTMMSTAP